ncbi:MAG TPA: hypothetical protein VFI02_15655 [Armatimonadota bacterium]|nr:hypothetical protein [Armatimonadota bacterium]
MRNSRLMITVGVLVIIGGVLFCRHMLEGALAQHRITPWAFPVSLFGVAGSLALFFLALRMYKFDNVSSGARILAIMIGVLGVLLWGTWSWSAVILARIPNY